MSTPLPHRRLTAIQTPAAGASRTRELIAFYLTSLLLSWPALLLWRLPADFRFGDTRAAREAYGQVGLFFGIGPAVAALAVTIAYRRKAGLRELLGRLTIWRLSPGWYLTALILPIVPQWIGIAGWHAITGEALNLAPWSTWLSRWVQISLFGGLFSLGEELGWRGFMLPRVLATRSWLGASIVVGVLWVPWHYPIWFAGAWSATGSLPTTIAMLLLASVTGLCFSVMVTWLFVRSGGSVPLAMLFHGSINANMNIFYEGAGDRALTSPMLLACTTAATVGVTLALVSVVNRHRSSGVD